MHPQGLVISDLHLLAKRSVGESLFAAIAPQVERCEALILNGDTFDFRWSTLRNESASIAAAIRWLEQLLQSMDGRDLHFIQGNHDCIRAFCERLEPLRDKWPNLHIHQYHLRLGRRIFLHGDCANRNMDLPELQKARESWANDKPRGGISATLYDAADLTGMSRAFHRAYFPRRITVARIAHHLDTAIPGWREKTGDCYFGHTHMPFRDHRHGGIRFHNSGSGIRGMGFHPIAFPLDKEEA
ncbi:hypothetical protein HZ994_03820 [Akkermansiaceae bacterium]|nr:hypothetical protein HZ994_03820 [Akkermansiaceae bacterium]